ncbi:MAG: hypothetical protein M1816_006944 [Peltula sp. TS41687]|nr:MAG: hypothetical protein M1816_006944 [Peltula sp. TS41687]
MNDSIIFLTGAPESSALDWTEDEILYSDLLPSFGGDQITEQGLVSTETRAAWRVLQFQRQHLRTGMTQKTPFKGWHDQYVGGSSFFTCSNISSMSPEKINSTVGEVSITGIDDEELLTQFYEHSLAVHEDVTTSQLGSDEQTDSRDDRTYISEDRTASLQESTLDSIEPSSSPPRLTSLQQIGQITDIIHIPNATYLQRIIPQTMTVNLIVGVIHISPARRVITRLAGRDMDVVEMLVGDETRAGFGISFWFHPEDAGKNPADNSNLRASLAALQPRDIILARNVALSSFRGRVYGQSLRREITKLHLLYRSPGDSPEKVNDDVNGLKLKRVRDWVVGFVGPPPAMRRRDGRVDDIRREILPPDTQ